ncbi:MAG: hypothetical protein CL944_01535 [Candidatus Diapherotrites archaeon]|uniref:Roadblock/LAMTOR2 domain-containing protein n=1 Tax=Candidatus Iainarchaeum sp. TaxID=3101447 RepID=A0A2D6LPL6_9ARCH|nr:hypothetical protein [Candidatus Diapherotrites archaeon]|tara:strand:- start:5048 stop:5512 length:465 start_codon:yes stop_codon:yes gene_type:complete
MFKAAKSLVKKFATKVLDLDDTVKPLSHLELFEDYLDKFEFDTNTPDVLKFLNILKKKHLVDDIVVATQNGSSVVSTNGNSVTTAVSGAAMFNYIQSEHPKSESVMIKSNGQWNMIFPDKDKLYIVKASSDLSVTEMRSLAKEIDTFLETRNLN